MGIAREPTHFAAFWFARVHGQAFFRCLCGGEGAYSCVHKNPPCGKRRKGDLGLRGYRGFDGYIGHFSGDAAVCKRASEFRLEANMTIRYLGRQLNPKT